VRALGGRVCGARAAEVTFRIACVCMALMLWPAG
jgi:hypothetical protein